MATTVVTRQSWFGRIGTSARNVFVGILLVIASCVLLFWNEGRAVKTHQALKEGASSVVSVGSDTVDPQNEGKLIHFTGVARTPSVLIDSEFGVGGPSLKLKRTVEVYQWVQNAESKTVEKLGGGTETTTTFTYKKEWRDDIVDSSDFKEQIGHENPSEKVFQNGEWIAENVSIGGYSIPKTMLEVLSGYEALPVTNEMTSALPYDMQERMQIVSGVLYYETDDPTNPAIGDTRISFETIPAQTLSVIGQQSGSSLKPYITKNKQTISFIQTGEATAKEMFDGAIQGNKLMTWILRAVGIILLFAGFRSTLGLLPIIAAVVPFVGRLIGAGVSIISAILTLVVELTVIAIAWLTYRPIIGIGLILAAVVIFILGTRLKKSKK